MAIVSEYIKTLVIGDMDMETTVVCPADEFVPLMKIRVPVRNRYFIGNGKINLGVDDRGTFKLDVETTAPANIPGSSRIKIYDSNMLNSRFIRDDISADAVAGVKTGIGGKTGNESRLPASDEYEYIVIEFSATATATATVADTTVQLPITIQALN